MWWWRVYTHAVSSCVSWFPGGIGFVLFIQTTDQNTSHPSLDWTHLVWHLMSIFTYFLASISHQSISVCFGVCVLPTCFCVLRWHSWKHRQLGVTNDLLNMHFNFTTYTNTLSKNHLCLCTSERLSPAATTAWYTVWSLPWRQEGFQLALNETPLKRKALGGCQKTHARACTRRAQLK